MALAFVFGFFAALAVSAADPLQYELRFERPNTHLLDITIQANGLSGGSVDFAMPDWAPGSYYIENYSAEVQGFQAFGPGQKPLVWRKTDEQTWRVELAGANAVTIQYQIYANTLANNHAQYNEEHAFLGGPAVWMYLVGGKERPVRLTINVPSGWKVATGMERTSPGGNGFQAANYDWLADSPIEISAFEEKTFDYSGTTFHVIVHDIEGKKDFSKFAGDTEKIVKTLVSMMAPVAGTGEQQAPFQQYWFLFHVWPHTGGGLEHLNSTQINFSSDWDSTASAGDFGTQYDLKLFVTAHEFYHAWNVKRLRPRPLGPFDYSRQVHTPSLWISEGLTSYYGSLALARAGLVTPQQYLDFIAKLITRFEQEPGRHERSIEDTSWDTWYRTVRTENNLANTNYSYYDGGQVVGHLLDFAIRQNTGNKKSLDDWMRLLYSRYALPKPGFEPDDAVRAASEVAGMDLKDFFHSYISGKEPLPYEQYFAYAGIAVEKKMNPEKPWVGVDTEKGEDGHAKINNIIPGSPAEMAGLDRGDSILAVDGKAVDSDSFGSTIQLHKPGDTLHVTVVRRDRLMEITLTLGANPYATYSLKPIEHPTDAQKAIYNSWLGVK
jgi:predicted metalloprotease with PDZ domain